MLCQPATETPFSCCLLLFSLLLLSLLFVLSHCQWLSALMIVLMLLFLLLVLLLFSVVGGRTYHVHFGLLVAAVAHTSAGYNWWRICFPGQQISGISSCQQLMTSLDFQLPAVYQVHTPDSHSTSTLICHDFRYEHCQQPAVDRRRRRDEAGRRSAIPRIQRMLPSARCAMRGSHVQAVIHLCA